MTVLIPGLLYLMLLIFFVWIGGIRYNIIQNKKRKEREESVAKFLQSLLPDLASLTEIADYTGLELSIVQDVLHALIKDKRVRVEGISFYYNMSDKRYPPKLRLVRCD